jgi:hypothetical protein
MLPVNIFESLSLVVSEKRCTFAVVMNQTEEEHIEVFEGLGEEDSSCFMAGDPSWRGVAEELEELQYLRGAQFVKQLKLIVYYGDFHPIEGEVNIFSALSKQSSDYDNLLNAARKAVEHGYRVYILPNPKGIKTADFIFEQKGNYKLYELKTPTGKSSVGTRLTDSLGQSNRVLLNMPPNYNTRLLAADIKKYFETNAEAVEVLIFKGKKSISIDRFVANHPSFYRLIKKRYEK